MPFPRVIDNSMRSAFVACPHDFFLRYIEGWKRPGTSAHLNFGAAFAAGLEATRIAFYERGESSPSAVAAGQSAAQNIWDASANSHDTKTLERCLGAISAYFRQYPPERDHLRPLRLTDGTYGIEFSGALPLPVSHPDTGEPLLYSGRFDMLAQMHGQIYVEDDKTTSMLGASWSRQWRLRAQFTGYCWLAQEYGYSPQGVVVRGISILKNGYGHAEVIEQRPQHMIREWHAQLLRDITRMRACYDSGDWDKSLDAACTAYGGCTFQDVCLSHQPRKWLEATFTQEEPFDPLNPSGSHK